jgi:hypothetical protein
LPVSEERFIMSTEIGYPLIELERQSQPAAVPSPAVDDQDSLVELLLKNRARLDQQLGRPERAAELAPRFLAIALGGFVTYGLVATLMLGAIQRTHGLWLAGVPAAHWYDRSAMNLVLAYALGMIGANGICLPSFYFYGLLAGLKITLVDVALHALKGMAAGALALVGVLPVYLAAALSAIVFPASKPLLTAWIGLALALPFLAGTWGAVCLYEGFFKLTVSIPADRREARCCLLRRFMLAWTACYTVVTPLVIYTLWHRLAMVLG